MWSDCEGRLHLSDEVQARYRRSRRWLRLPGAVLGGGVPSRRMAKRMAKAPLTSSVPSWDCSGARAATTASSSGTSGRRYRGPLLPTEWSARHLHQAVTYGLLIAERDGPSSSPTKPAP